MDKPVGPDGPSGQTRGLRVLFISLELLGPVFSGNGIYSRSLVRALKTVPGLACLVISGRGSGLPLESQDAEWLAQREAPHGLIDLPLDVWGRLDRESGWASLREQASTPAVAAAVASFGPDVVAAVDWHGTCAWAGLREALLNAAVATTGPSAAAAAQAASCKVVYLNFRVYCTSAGLAAADSDLAFYRAQELAAMRVSACTVALCRADALALAALAAGVDPMSRYPLEPAELVEGPFAEQPDIRILLPPLRQDMLRVCQAACTELREADAPRRDLVVCAVRASPEKGLHRLAGWLRALRPVMDELHLTPFICGARAAGSTYAAEALSAIAAAYPGTHFEEAFMGPAELHAVFRRAALNIHPCLADAYGMTVIEAAACGAPSLVHVPSRSPDSKGRGAAPSLAAAAHCFVSGWGDSACEAGGSGFLRLQLSLYCNSVTGAAAAWQSAAAELLAAPLATVGACDLIAPAGDSAGGIVPVDMTLPDTEVAAVAGAMLHDESALRAVAARAELVAVSWTETLSRDALLSILREYAAPR